MVNSHEDWMLFFLGCSGVILYNLYEMDLGIQDKKGTTVFKYYYNNRFSIPSSVIVIMLTVLLEHEVKSLHAVFDELTGLMFVFLGLISKITLKVLGNKLRPIVDYLIKF